MRKCNIVCIVELSVAFPRKKHRPLFTQEFIHKEQFSESGIFEVNHIIPCRGILS
jgi:hypothetical protein